MAEWKDKGPNPAGHPRARLHIHSHVQAPPPVAKDCVKTNPVPEISSQEPPLGAPEAHGGLVSGIKAGRIRNGGSDMSPLVAVIIAGQVQLPSAPSWPSVPLIPGTPVAPS